MLDARPMIEAEALVLGACLLDERAIFSVMDRLKPEMFADVGHRALFAAMLESASAGEPIDASLLTTKNPSLLGVVTDTMRGAAGSANVEHYAGHVVRFWHDRELDRIGREIQALASDREDNKVGKALQLLMGVSADGAKGGLVAGKERMRAVVDYIEERYKSGGGMIGQSTGFFDLDTMLSGWRPGCLYLIAGRPGMGKTAVSLNTMIPTARAGLPVLVFSMEMPARELDLRIISSIGNIPHHMIEHAKFDESDTAWHSFTNAASDLADMPILIDDTPGQTLAAVASRAKREALKRGQIGMIVVDYLQLMKGEGDNRTQELGSLSRGLKALAKELNCPVLALSQLNRQCEARIDKRPVTSDLRESGDLEQDADVVVMIYRDSVYHPESQLSQHRVGELIVRKNRHGMTGTVRVIDQLDYSRYVNAEKGVYDLPMFHEEAKPNEGGKGFDLA